MVINNYITSVWCHRDYSFFNFGFQNGTKSELNTFGVPLTELKIDMSSKIRRVVLWYGDLQGILGGIQLFGKDGEILLQTQKDFQDLYTKETLIEMDEFIVGFKSYKASETKSAQHIDFQLLIGKT